MTHDRRRAQVVAVLAGGWLCAYCEKVSYVRGNYSARLCEWCTQSWLNLKESNDELWFEMELSIAAQCVDDGLAALSVGR